MYSTHIDKIGSVTYNIPLTHDIILTDTIKSEPGTIIVGKVLNEKSKYNELELTSGRMARVKKGDIVVGALGARAALQGFVGEIPDTVKVGDTIQILNMGGVMGICTSENMEYVGKPFDIEVLGSVAEQNIQKHAVFTWEKTLPISAPLILVTGTCMNSGKTAVCAELIKQLNFSGMKIAAAKLTGIGCIRDILLMEDYGAVKATNFVDGGMASTVGYDKDIAAMSNGALTYLNQANPDAIVIEFGDGVCGEYGVKEILKNIDIQKHTLLHIGCAHDPMGAWKLAEECEAIGIPLDIVSGPLTDNSTGKNFIKNELNLEAFNALQEAKQLGAYCLRQLQK